MLDIHNEIYANGGGPGLQEFTSALAPWAIGLGFAFSLGLWSLVSITRLPFIRFVLLGLTVLEILAVAAEIFAAQTNMYLAWAAAGTATIRAASLVFLFNEESILWMKR